MGDDNGGEGPQFPKPMELRRYLDDCHPGDERTIQFQCYAYESSLKGQAWLSAARGLAEHMGFLRPELERQINKAIEWHELAAWALCSQPLGGDALNFIEQVQETLCDPIFSEMERLEAYDEIAAAMEERQAAGRQYWQAAFEEHPEWLERRPGSTWFVISETQLADRMAKAGHPVDASTAGRRRRQFLAQLDEDQ